MSFLLCQHDHDVHSVKLLHYLHHWSISPLWWCLQHAVVLADQLSLRGGCGRQSTHHLLPWTSHPKENATSCFYWSLMIKSILQSSHTARLAMQYRHDKQNFTAPYQMLSFHFAYAHHANCVRWRVCSGFFIFLWSMIHKVTWTGGWAVTGLGCHRIVSLQ